jgi:dipeptide/tripeptide permease
MSLIHYWVANLGALLGFAIVYAEKLVGFWLAFLLPGIMSTLLLLVLLSTRNKITHKKPRVLGLKYFFRIVRVACRRNEGQFWKKDFWNAAKPSVLAQEGITTEKGGGLIPWSDKRVDDVRRTVIAFIVFLHLPVWSLNNGGIGTLANAQAAGMKTDRATNDLFRNFNPLTVLIFIPLLSCLIYPTLERINLAPRRIIRITFGFTLT